MEKVFTGKEDFEAYHEAKKWCKENGYSYGSMQGTASIGIVKGNCYISKWRNMSSFEKKSLDGVIDGNKRYGPITIKIYSEDKECNLK